MLNAWSDLSAKCIDPNELGIHVSRNGNMDTQRKLISKRGLTFYDGNSQEDLEKVVREFCDSNLEYTGKYAPNYLFDCDTKTLSYATEDALSLVSSAHRCLIIENPSKNSQKANDRYTFLVDQIVKRWHEKQKELEQVLNNMSANDPINGTDKMLILMKSRLLPLNKETLTQQGLLIANIIFEIAKFGKSTDPQKRFLASLGDAKDILDKNSLGLSLSKETGHTQQIFGITVILNLNCVNVLAPSRIAYVKGLLPERLSDDEGRWRYANPKLWPSKLKDAFLALPENAPERNQNVTYEH